MRESNIHMSYPNTVIVHHRNQTVFLALPEGASWRDARHTFASLMNLDVNRTLLVSFRHPNSREEPVPYADGEAVDWNGGSCVRALSVEVSADGKQVLQEPILPPNESRGAVPSAIPLPLAMNLDAWNPIPNTEG
ncbi:hypothetical protein, conserved [Trypanosoma brucei gambiense DAL972]|uniref:Uncharacterized protein n=2 Tax=Trypanosoma brucei TaxID=5691 RepID=C9ZRA9_TRYB9|nr:hypothetical protein, conserved [Trypanosoma brucei gambiense DAL972]RHW72150.1 hypothetical protein DPX39_060047600 [Trypanosoma brucei equiperdum]CBH11939.1 hypothetical protein, conserved [Trypanosoma brucei gambiense DAL972]|eukprot:XP_011774224.1 hypothetical protein, conserved [Trypanosoma brucei gambiense DAL972]